MKQARVAFLHTHIHITFLGTCLSPPDSALYLTFHCHTPIYFSVCRVVIPLPKFCGPLYLTTIMKVGELYKSQSFSLSNNTSIQFSHCRSMHTLLFGKLCFQTCNVSYKGYIRTHTHTHIYIYTYTYVVGSKKFSA